MAVEASNVNHAGKAELSASVALYVKLSLSSTSVKKLVTSRLKALSSVADWLPSGLATVGASLVLATVRVKVESAVAPALSVAVTLTLISPTSSLAGVPSKVPVAVSNVNHAGKAELSASVALYVKLSPASTSAKVPAGIAKLKALSSVADWLPMPVVVGASLVLATVRVKVESAVAPALSVAVTLTLISPTSSLAGVPSKVPVAVSNVNHAGKAELSASVALYVKLSPASTSAKLPVTSRLKALSSVAVWLPMPVVVGASLVLATVRVKVESAVAPALSVAVTLTLISPTSSLAGVPLKVPVEASNVSHAGIAVPSERVAL